MLRYDNFYNIKFKYLRIISQPMDQQLEGRSTIKTKTNSCMKIHDHLVSKYSAKFLFFMVKPINEIVYNDTKSLANISSKDCFFMAEQSEFLNRMYHYFNATGKEEIYDRIRLIGGFYSNNTMSLFTTMIITNTVKIFQTRYRRLRKMIASDGSSDQSQVPTQNHASFESQGFLAQVSSNFQTQSSLGSMFKSVQQEQVYDETIHDIYDSERKIYEVSSVKYIYDIQDKNVNHLICDFDEIDEQKTLADYQLLMKLKKKKDNQLTLKSLLDKKPVFQSIIINERNNREYKSKGKHKRLLSQRNNDGISVKNETDYNGNYQYENPRSNGRSSRQKVYRDYYKRKEHKRAQELNDRDWRRQKIRDKAAELLSKVKSQNYLKGRVDYVNY